jgi:hypothetical protein
VNVKVVSERLGHSKIQSTLDTYQHVLPTMQEKAARVLGVLFGNPEKQAIGYNLATNLPSVEGQNLT